MALVNRVLRVARVRTSKGVMPLSGDLRASGHRNDSLRDRLLVRVDAAIADEVVRGHVADRLRSTEKYESIEPRCTVGREGIRRRDVHHRSLAREYQSNGPGRRHSHTSPGCVVFTVSRGFEVQRVEIEPTDLKNGMRRRREKEHR